MRSSGWRKRVELGFGLGIVALLCVPATPILGHVGLETQIARLTDQIETTPGDAGLYLRRGELHRVHGDWGRAEEDYRRARLLDPDLAIVDFCSGRMFLESGRPILALGPVERFLAERPQHVEARVVRARALVRVGRSHEAAEEYTRAIGQFQDEPPPRPEYYLERARALVAGGDDHLPKAIAGLDEGMARLGPIVSLQEYAIDLELESGRFEEALRRLDTVAVSRGRRESILARRGAILESAGRVDDARQAYLQARAAIRALPQTHRRKRATLELEASVESALGRLGAEAAQ